jgi:HSP20 family protein
MSSFYAGSDIASGVDAVREQMDQVFRRLGFPASLRAMSAGEFPKLNIGSTPDSLEILAFAAGVEPDKLQVTVDKGLLTISGERPSEVGTGDTRAKTIYARERARGAFSRVIELPQDADPENVAASYQDGCLRISVQKRESSRPRLIPIQ